MKKILSSILFTLMVHVGYSQMRHQPFIGGNLNFSYGESSYNDKDGQNFGSRNEKTTSIRILPTAGYFISEKLAVGLGIGYRNFHVKSKYEFSAYPVSEGKTTENSFHFKPFVRYNRFLGKRVSIFGEGEVEASFGKSRAYNDSLTTGNGNTKSVSVGIRPGLIFFVTDRIGIETTYGYLGYSFYKTNNEQINAPYPYMHGYQHQGVALNFGLSSLYFGIQFYLGRKDTDKEEK